MTRTGLVAVLMVVGWLSTQAMGAATLYLSTTPLNGTVPTPGNANVTIAPGESVTLYLWASLGTSATSTIIGLDYMASNPAIVDPTGVTVWNDVIRLLDPEGDAQDPENWIYRWNGYNVVTTEPKPGFAAAGGFDDPQGVNAVGLTSSSASADPTRRGAATPYQFYVGAVTFQGVTPGETDIFLTSGKSLISGNAAFIGSVAAPVLSFGTGDSPLPVSSSGGTLYIAEGVQSSVADAHITVLVPEPATLGLLALGGLALARRR